MKTYWFTDENGVKWARDENGNRNSVTYWGSEEKAQSRLESNTACSGCSDCSDCTDCYASSFCTACSACWGCSGLYGGYGKKYEVRENDARKLADLLCPPHAGMDEHHNLKPFDNCIACIRNERDELLAENAALREALTKIADHSAQLPWAECACLARAALSGSPAPSEAESKRC